MDWSDIMKKYKGKWVALQEDEKTVIAAAKEGVDAYNLARQRGFEEPIMLKVPQSFYKNLPQPKAEKPLSYLAGREYKAHRKAPKQKAAAKDIADELKQLAREKALGEPADE